MNSEETAMFYAERDQAGTIIAIKRYPGGDNVDQKPLSEQEVEAFLASEFGRTSYEVMLRAADQKMIRVLDDLIDVLVRKNIIMLTDLPDEAREKLGSRQEVRRRMHDEGDDLTVDDIL
jgi:hypothetical protein